MTFQVFQLARDETLLPQATNNRCSFVIAELPVYYLEFFLQFAASCYLV